MLDEECDLTLRQVEDTRRYELLMTPGAEEAQVVEPFRDRVPLAVSQLERSGKAERGHTRGCIVVTYRSDAEGSCRVGHRSQVPLVD